VVDTLLDLLQQLQEQRSRRRLQLQSFTQQQHQQLTVQQQEQPGSFTQLPLSQTLRSFESFDSQLGFDLPELELRQQRRSEVLYLVQAQPPPQQQQQQQVAGDDDPAAAAIATAAAAGGSGAGGGGVLCVQEWPWECVGLKGGQGGTSSADETSDGEAAAALRSVSER
jgi:hypothetical protein